MRLIPLGILSLVLIGVACWLIFSNLLEKTSTSQQPTTPSPLTPSNDPSQIDLGAGGSSYLDKDGIFSILYPNDFTLDTQDIKHIRIYKRGVTQRPQSEMSDGVLIVFETIDLQNETLGDWVTSRINESTADGTLEVIEPKKSIIQNGYPGFSYALRGLGISKNVVLQKDDKSNHAVVITYSVSDPEQNGYQNEVNKVLSSLKLLK